ncbi:hypothetical protein ABB37_06941 [Leptomonas pyrrhocoris]|uniref:Nucleotide-diphospho-sugar transferase domain-containing protein n=1 Tax=Leptomonas pyrrhocoris TaxID=157538 RepID=A0A0M9FWK7_LEPPY|nr:hypothetical protein ABB37_06941 [Leptomonas pyrrhocoris]KPA77570.1 hypothetical protein ABB37_06941 [Leptomonas pyrrhocoris]|eukprot:XP_015656009.1 hypothetical protein ABB37_06941 [Leptomonas pyrrhocoris]
MASRKVINAVCTMATRECAEELALFHRSFRTFHPALPLFVGCTTEMRDEAPQVMHDDAHVRWVSCLDGYGPSISRRAMERAPGVWYATRHTDFMMEKANLMELAMRSTDTATASASAAPTVAFLDCDVTLLQALPTVPMTASVALSPHQMRSADESLFGRFNGGYVVASSPEVLWEWRRATATSRYFDQASLEHVADVFRERNELHCLPAQHNYGFWRMLQPQRGSAFDQAKRFSIAPRACPTAPTTDALTIHYDEHPLCSLHTHFFLHGANVPRDVRLFNDLLRRWIKTCAAAEAGSLQNHAYAAALSHLLKPGKEPMNGDNHS